MEYKKDCVSRASTAGNILNRIEGSNSLANDQVGGEGRELKSADGGAMGGALRANHDQRDHVGGKVVEPAATGQ